MGVLNSLRSMLTGGFDYRRHDDGHLCMYRCTECGYLAFTVGGLHGHIEGHRPIRHIWRIGWDVDWLADRTERLWLMEMKPETNEPIEYEAELITEMETRLETESETEICAEEDFTIKEVTDE